jgi:AcrR family transcriptional regulator
MPSTSDVPQAADSAGLPGSGSAATRNAAPRPGGKTDRTRLRLVAAVRSEFEASGGFTADLVVRRAGSSPATFYNHFASKEDALIAAYSAAMDDLVEFVTRQLQIERILDAGLERFASNWVLQCVAFFRDNSVVFRAAQMQAPLSETLREVYRAHERAALEIYERFVRLGQRAQMIRPGDTSAIAYVMMITSEGYNNPAILRMDAGDALHRELSRAVVRMLEPETQGP